MPTEHEERRDTRQRVLDAACEVFAEEGYRDGTVQEICAAAGANVAAVNYYFGSKRELYLEVWQAVTDSVREKYFTAVREIRDPGKRLRSIIRQRVLHAFDDRMAGNLRKLVQCEMGDPTDSHAEIEKRFLNPYRTFLVRTIAEILKVDETDPAAQRCAYSLHSQLIFLNVLRMKGKARHVRMLIGGESPSPEQLESFIDHMETFVLGGIQAVAQSLRDAGREAS